MNRDSNNWIEVRRVWWASLAIRILAPFAKRGWLLLKWLASQQEARNPDGKWQRYKGGDEL